MLHIRNVLWIIYVGFFFFFCFVGLSHFIPCNFFNVINHHHHQYILTFLRVQLWGVSQAVNFSFVPLTKLFSLVPLEDFWFNKIATWESVLNVYILCDKCFETRISYFFFPSSKLLIGYIYYLFLRFLLGFLNSFWLTNQINFVEL